MIENLYRLGGIVLMLLLWYIGKILFLQDSIFLPYPHEVFERLFLLLSNGKLFADMAYTFTQFGKGLLLAFVVGYPLGLLIGYIPKLYLLLEVPIDFFRSIPATVLYPIFLAIFGLNAKTTTAMVFTASVMVIVLNIAYGVFYANPIRRKAFQLLKPSLWQTMRYFIIPESFPSLFLSIRLAVSLSLIVGVVSELFIGSAEGLGARVMLSYETLQFSEAFAVILVVGMLGYGLNRITKIMEIRVVHWVKHQKI
jgi:ABC-type nitrate/sulfonate/bicarbonate transport system permease component